MKFCPECGLDIDSIRPTVSRGKRAKFCGSPCWRRAIRTSTVVTDADANCWIVTARGQKSRISPEDAAFAQTRSWHVDTKGYLRSGRVGRFHNLLMGKRKGLICDHINRDRLDNRRENLRLVPPAINVRNNGGFKTNTSGIAGVSRARNQWHAYIHCSDKRIFLGAFNSLEEARLARLAGEIRFWGDQR